jgi:competence protein ComFC
MIMNIADSLIELVAPHCCIGCGVEGLLLCQACRTSSLPSVPSRCYRCHRATKDYRVCSKCKNSSSLNRVFVVTDYDNLAKELIHKLKFERGMSASKEIAEIIGSQFGDLDKNIIIVHLPTANSRIRQRGYDQAELIAKYFAKQTGLKRKKPLKRNSFSRQVGASRKQRFAQLENAFEIKNQDAINGKNIILVDDVVTTGASIESAAKNLKNAGAKGVDAILFAQVSL